MASVAVEAALLLPSLRWKEARSKAVLTPKEHPTLGLLHLALFPAPSSFPFVSRQLFGELLCRSWFSFLLRFTGAFIVLLFSSTRNG